tara:strand:+ start:7836 stop:8105 length:270 start_codon:yes stop_codon:yes gene_type:complete
MTNLIKNKMVEITSTKLNLIYVLDEDYGYKYVLSTMGADIPIDKILFSNKENVNQQFVDWAHNNIANELQGVIDDVDTIMEIRIWNKNR